MYIDPFVCGVVSTLVVEIVLVFVYAIVQSKRK